MWIILGLSLMGPPWLVLSTSEGKVRGPRPWPLNHTNCMVPEEGWTEGLVPGPLAFPSEVPWLTLSTP